MKHGIGKSILIFGIAAAAFFTVLPGRQVADPAVLEVQAAGDGTQLLSPENLTVLGNVIGAVENGGQIYGRKDYGAFVPAFHASDAEYTCTLGWCSCYGQNAHDLIQLIYQSDPQGFAKTDPDGIILQRLATDWVAEQWNPNEEEKAILLSLITSPIGQQCQDQMFYRLITDYLTECNVLYGITDPKALMMYSEIELLGGSAAAQRVFNRCDGDYSVMAILNALFQDFDGNMDGNLVGSPKYWQRHLVCATYINQFAQ